MRVNQDFGDFDEWQATCINAGRGIADEHSLLPTHHRSRARLQLCRACTEPLPHSNPPADGAPLLPLRLRRPRPRSLPNPLASAPSTQDQGERYAVCTFRMAVLLT